MYCFKTVKLGSIDSFTRQSRFHLQLVIALELQGKLNGNLHFNESFSKPCA